MGFVYMGKRSSQFNKFYDSIFGDRVNYWRDGPGTKELLSLNSEEKQIAEDLLLDNISKNDPYIFECLGLLKSRKAENYLRNMLNKCDSNLVPSISLSLWRIANDQVVVARLAELLKNQNEFIRIDTVISLGQIDNDDARQTILTALNDSSFLVRYNALRAISGFPTDVETTAKISMLTKKEALLDKKNYFKNIENFLKDKIF